MVVGQIEAIQEHFGLHLTCLHKLEMALSQRVQIIIQRVQSEFHGNSRHPVLRVPRLGQQLIKRQVGLRINKVIVKPKHITSLSKRRLRVKFTVGVVHLSCGTP